MGGNTPDTDEGACRCRRHRAVCRGKRNVCTNPGSRHCSASNSQRLCQRDCRGCSWAHSSWQSWEWVTFLASSGFYCPACTCASWHTVQLDQNRQICIDFIQSVYTQHTHMYGCAYASVPGQNAAMDQLHILNGSQLPGALQRCAWLHASVSMGLSNSAAGNHSFVCRATIEITYGDLQSSGSSDHP